MTVRTYSAVVTSVFCGSAGGEGNSATLSRLPPPPLSTMALSVRIPCTQPLTPRCSKKEKRKRARLKVESEIRFGAGLGEEELEKGMGWGKERGRRSRSYSTVFFLFPFRGGPERHKLPFKSDTGGQGYACSCLFVATLPLGKTF